MDSKIKKGGERRCIPICRQKQFDGRAGLVEGSPTEGGKGMESIIASLNGDDRSRRKKSAGELLEMAGKDPKEAIRAIDALSQALNDEDWEIRKIASETIKIIGKECPGEVNPVLLNGFDRDAELKTKALEDILCHVSNDSDPERLIADLRNEDPVRRIGSIEALGRIASQEHEGRLDAIHAIIGALGDRNINVSITAQKEVESLVRIEPETVLPLLMDMQGVMRESSFRWMLEGLVKDIVPASDARAVLSSLLAGEGVERTKGIEAFGAFARKKRDESLETISSIVKSCGNEESMRYYAFETVLTLGRTNPGRVVHAILDDLDSVESHMRIHALREVIGTPITKDEAGKLIPSLKKGSTKERIASALALGRLAGSAGLAHSEAIKALVGALDDGIENVRYDSADALLKIGMHQPDLVVSAMLEEKRGLYGDVRRYVLQNLLKGYESEMEIAIPILVSRLGGLDGAEDGLIAAARASPEKIFPALIARLDDEPHIREHAADLIHRISEMDAQSAASALPELLAVFRKGDAPESITLALGEIGKINPESIAPALIEALEERKDDNAAKALGRIVRENQAMAREAIPALIYRAKADHPDSYLSMCALGELAEHDPEKVISAMLEISQMGGHMEERVQGATVFVIKSVAEHRPDLAARMLPFLSRLAIFSYDRDKRRDVIETVALIASGHAGSKRRAIPILASGLENDATVYLAAKSLGEIAHGDRLIAIEVESAIRSTNAIRSDDDYSLRLIDEALSIAEAEKERWL